MWRCSPRDVSFKQVVPKTTKMDPDAPGVALAMYTVYAGVLAVQISKNPLRCHPRNFKVGWTTSC